MTFQICPSRKCFPLPLTGIPGGRARILIACRTWDAKPETLAEASASTRDVDAPPLETIVKGSDADGNVSRSYSSAACTPAEDPGRSEAWHETPRFPRHC